MFILVIAGVDQRNTPIQVIENNKNKDKNDQKLEEMEAFLMEFVPEKATEEPHIAFGTINTPEVSIVPKVEEPKPISPPSIDEDEGNFVLNGTVGDSTASEEPVDPSVAAEVEALDPLLMASLFMDETDEAKEKELEKAKKAEEAKKAKKDEEANEEIIPHIEVA